MDELTTALLAIVAGGTGAAAIKLIDNVVQWVLHRKNEKDAAKGKAKQDARAAKDQQAAKERAEINEFAHETHDAFVAHETWAKQRIDLLCDCVAIFAIEQITSTCKWAIHDKQISLYDLQRIHALYAKAHAIGANSDLEYLVHLVEELPVIDPMKDNETSTTERREFYDLAQGS